MLHFEGSEQPLMTKGIVTVVEAEGVENIYIPLLCCGYDNLRWVVALLDKTDQRWIYLANALSSQLQHIAVVVGGVTTSPVMPEETVNVAALKKTNDTLEVVIDIRRSGQHTARVHLIDKTIGVHTLYYRSIPEKLTENCRDMNFDLQATCWY